MKINILTIFPEMFAPLKMSMLGRAIENGIIELDVVDIRDFTTDKHNRVDDTPYGGGMGMLTALGAKFTDEGGAVKLSVKREGGYARVSVTDTGCGIDSETGRHIFDKFYQGDTSHAAKGNGLGLALVKRIIDIVDGEIGVRSAPGEGSTFTVTLKEEENNE